ncbi:MAG: CDP-glucose 4,6-dehydratase [Rhodospirillales bacterium]|nr:CDP-glucose 4,6-dehydratase [Rhodospirillales bacterium]MBN8903500.1 CDP-glucose 4,6-dehydratase [Rhodospirillales bacterium]
MNRSPHPGLDPRFWAGKRVLLTGHTGFKGAWAALWLHRLGARVTGLALPPDGLNLYDTLGIERFVPAYHADLRDAAAVADVVRACEPELVLHLGAQALVPVAHRHPVDTFATNLLGTVHLLDALRDVDGLRAVLIVTTDKVYLPCPDGTPHRETDRLGGLEPYAASKAACELATAAMARTYLAPRGIPVATARGGNVVGGGDFASGRLVPDAVRAALTGVPLALRNPQATRPWQHVLDCLSGYFAYLAALADHQPLPAALNFGPAPIAAPITVAAFANAIMDAFGAAAEWAADPAPHPPETHALALDSTQARAVLDWRQRMPAPLMLSATADWYRAWAAGEPDMEAFTLRQIAAYEALP